MLWRASAQLVDSYSLYSGSDGSDKDSATMYRPDGKDADKLGAGLPVRQENFQEKER